MNVEMSFVHTDSRSALLEIVASRLKESPDSLGKQPDWGVPSSYDVLLATERKRKIGVSPVQGGWVALVESNEVVDFALDAGKISASLLQRRFRVGYNRAARIIDLLEERGIIGAANGSKPREVLVALDKSNND